MPPMPPMPPMSGMPPPGPPEDSGPRSFGNHRLGGDEKASNGRCIFKRSTHDLGRIDNARFDEIRVDLVLGIEPEGTALVLTDLADNHRTVHTGVLGNLPGRTLQRAAQDPDAGILVLIFAPNLFGGHARHAAVQRHRLRQRLPEPQRVWS